MIWLPDQSENVHSFSIAMERLFPRKPRAMRRPYLAWRELAIGENMNAKGQVRALEGRSIHLVKEKRGWRFTIHNRHGNEIDIGVSYSAETFDALVTMIKKYVEVV